MLVISKYNISIQLYFENFKKFKNYKNRFIKKINFSFSVKLNFLRNFIFFFSYFLISSQISSIMLHNKLKNPINFNYLSLLLINNDYRFFY